MCEREWLSLFRRLCFRFLTPLHRAWAGVGEPVEVVGEAEGAGVVGGVGVVVEEDVEVEEDAEAVGREP